MDKAAWDLVRGAVKMLKGSVNLCLLVNIKCHGRALTRDLQSLQVEETGGYLAVYVHVFRESCMQVLLKAASCL